MRNQSLSSFAAGLVACLLTTACQTPATTLQPAWIDESQADVTYSKLVVIGAFARDQYKGLVEEDLVRRIRRQGVDAKAGAPVLRQFKFSLSEKNAARIGRELKTRGFDGALVVRFVDLDQDLEYHPGESRIEKKNIGRLSTQEAPLASSQSGAYTYYTHRDFASYNAETYRRVYEPGSYEVKSTRVVFETSFYSLKTGRLVWTARSTTVDPRSASAFSRSFSAALVAALISDHVILPGE